MTRRYVLLSGGVGGALKRFAQRVYDALKPDEQTIARNIFAALCSRRT